ncbi:RidA family protein [Salinarchaeum chitinilyticum]
MDRTEISSGTEWEDEVGYSRAVRVGDRIEVAGTTATDENGDPVAPGRPYEQATHAFGLVEDAVRDAGGEPADVVRTRMFVTDADDWEQIGRAHGEHFGDAKPASTLVEVQALIDPALVVEVEATAIAE